MARYSRGSLRGTGLISGNLLAHVFSTVGFFYFSFVSAILLVEVPFWYFWCILNQKFHFEQLQSILGTFPLNLVL